MYYLQSRYYDAKICRFINADSALYHSMLGYNLYAYCDNNPVIMIDITGQYCVAIMDDDGNLLNDWILEGASSGGYSATGNYIGPGSAYYNYSVRSLTAAYDARLGGYHSNSVSSGITNTGYYFVPGAVSVTDDIDNSYNLNGAKNEKYISKRGWDDIKINKAINNGVQGTSINKANGAKCVVYRYPGTTNQYVVIDSGTRSIVQLSDLNDAGWIPDSTIIWIQ